MKFRPDTQAVFRFALIEHISFADGERLLSRIGNKFIIITTPSKFEVGALDGHACLWSEEDLRQHGFITKTYSTGYFRDRIYGKKIIAVRGGDRF